MQEGSSDVHEPPASPPLHQPATVFAAIATPAPSSSATTGMDIVTTINSDDDSDATGPPEETPERETETRQEAEATDRTREEKPEQPETPDRSALPPRTAEHARADETAAQAAPDVDTFKPDGCTTPPPPPAHDSEGSDAQSADDHGSSPCRENPKPAGASGKRPDVAAAKLRLLAFRSFSRDKKGKKSGDAAPPEGRVPSPGEHRPVYGKAWEEAGAENKEKGKARWKRFCK